MDDDGRLVGHLFWATAFPYLFAFAVIYVPHYVSSTLCAPSEPKTPTNVIEAEVESIELNVYGDHGRHALIFWDGNIHRGWVWYSSARVTLTKHGVVCEFVMERRHGDNAFKVVYRVKAKTYTHSTTHEDKEATYRRKYPQCYDPITGNHRGVIRRPEKADNPI